MTKQKAQQDPNVPRSGAKRETPAIAIVGMGCQYPGANSPQALWENVLGKRRQFREMPAQRMPLSDYYSNDKTVADKTYGRRAAVIDGFEFDWASWRIPKTTFETTDIVHWLALATARQALKDTGWDLNNLPTHKMGVVVGNTLTGEFTRANSLRVRWPYMRRAFLATAEARQLPAEATQALLDTLETIYKSPFAKMTEDSLAGGLSNTIAGRICNAFNFDGGGYTVDGACASSLIAVKTAAAALTGGELDCAIAGGVDISLDPMELVGFAKTGALTATDMTVYDQQADGFIPGEGCGFVVLKRLIDARRDGDYIYATLDGWGISSDGKGGLTAPSDSGQAKALRQAYAMLGKEELPDFIEGHGTGTKVGDRVELAGIELAIQDRLSQNQQIPELASTTERSLGITSFKSIVGHTKAAAGIGGFIKAVIAVNQRIIPPTAGCSTPSSIFENEARSVYPVLTGEIRPHETSLRAGISAMGFGGINAHAVLTSANEPATKLRPSLAERALMVSGQETELIVFSASSIADLQAAVQTAKEEASGLSLAELTDYAAHLSQSVQPNHPARAALLASSIEQLEEQIQQLSQLLATGIVAGEVRAIAHQGIWLSYSATPARIGFLFPGQGSQRLNMARTLVERYDWARQRVEQADKICQEVGGYRLTPLMYRAVERAATPTVVSDWKAGLTETQIAQPSICLASLLWYEYLTRLGIQATAMCGHSLGELSAFWAAGAMDAQSLLRWAALRGQAMAQNNRQPGRMVSLSCGSDLARSLVKSAKGLAVVANYNSPSQTVISGEVAAVESVMQMAIAQGIEVKSLPVSSAFHSPLMEKAAEAISKNKTLKAAAAPLRATLFSCLNGAQVQPGTSLSDYFARAITAPIDFVSAVQAMSAHCDVMVEVGSGRVLSGLANDITAPTAIDCWPVEGKAQSDRTLNTVIAEAFIRGSAINWPALYENRLVRPFVPATERQFITNPCERPLEIPATEPLALFTKPSANVETTENRSNTNGSQAEPVQPTDWTAQLGQYFSQRGSFLAEVIRADMKASSNGTLSAVNLSASSNGYQNNGYQNNGHQNNDHQNNSYQNNGHHPKAVANVSQSDAPSPAKEQPIQIQIERALIDLIVERTGYSPETVQPEMRLLDELNLDSIKATEIVVSVAAEFGAAERLDPTNLANASLQTLAQAIAVVANPIKDSSQENKTSNISATATAASWVRNFAIQYVPKKIEQNGQTESWAQARVLILTDDLSDPVSKKIARKLSKLGAKIEQATYEQASIARSAKQDSAKQSLTTATHYIAILPRQQVETTELPLAQMVARLSSLATLAKDNACAAYVQFGSGQFGQTGNVHPANCCAAAFARSLHLERPQLKVRAIDCDAQSKPSQIAKQVIAELPGEDNIRSAGYDAAGKRSEPQTVLQQPQQYAPRAHAWSNQDVVLVTGGAKGITAECALAFAQQTGAKMALVGRSSVPTASEVASEAENEITQTLARYRENGEVCRYYSCDITDAVAVRQLIQTIQADLGTVSGVIHGAGLNRPRRVEQVTQEQAIAEVSPKLLGAMNLMQALSASPPKLFAAFSSIIGVTGMQGNAWYGFANEALDVALRQFDQQHPNTQTIAIAYSIWDEVGMGARMGSIHQLAQMGIAAIPKAEGVNRFLQLAQRDPGVSQVMVAARLGGLDTWHRPDLPTVNFRFVERVERVEPGVEGVVRSHLTLASDPYLKDHFWRGSYLFPTVFGLEAMAQTAAYIMRQPALSICQIEAIDLQRPIVVDPQKGLEIELRAIVNEVETNGQQRVRVGIRTAQTGFAKDHFSATLVIGERQRGEQRSPAKQTPISTNPKERLYGSGLLFQGERFQQIEQVVSLTDKTAVFLSHIQDEDSIVQTSLAGISSTFLLGDPYHRDSLLQSLQLTIPQDICLPIQIDKIELFCPATDSAIRIGTANLLDRQDKDYLGELISTDETGTVTERLSGYRLRILETHAENPTATALALQLSQPEEASQSPSRPLSIHQSEPLALSSDRSTSPINPATNCETAQLARYQKNGPQGQLTYEQQFQVSFKESAGLGRKVYFSQYFRWVGQIRELPMERIAPQMMADFLTGQWGMVTNSVSLRIVGEATAYDTVQARAWIGVVEGSSFTTYIEFCRVLPNDKLERLAIAEVRATWVALVSYGVPVPKPFPPYLSDYIEQFTAEHPEDLDLRSPHSLPLPNLPAGLLNISKGETVAQVAKQSGSRYGQLLKTETFQTTLEESNLVGNVYYGNYFIWQGRLLDLFLYSVAPEYMRVSNAIGELVCTYTRMDYLREAMPFDKIRAQLYIDSVFECGAVFRFEFFREQPDGSVEKLHVGEQEAIWVKRDSEGTPIATPWPAEIANAFRQKVGNRH